MSRAKVAKGLTSTSQSSHTDQAEGPRLDAIRGFIDADSTTDLKLIGHRVRLGMLSALAVSESMSFAEIRGLLGLTDGNLSVHARKLEEAGLVRCSKGFDNRTPRTDYTLTDRGSDALERYLSHMEALIAATHIGNEPS